MTRSRKYTKRRLLRKRRGTKRRHRRRSIKRQYGGRGMTTSVDTNPNEMNEEENILERRMRIIN